MRTKTDRHACGFTLVELLVVIAIVGFLGAVALPQYQRLLWKTRRTEAIVILNAIHKQELSYFGLHSQYYPPHAQCIMGATVPLATGNEFFGLPPMPTKIGWQVSYYLGTNSCLPDFAATSMGYQVEIWNDFDGDPFRDRLFIKANPMQFFQTYRHCPDGVPFLLDDDTTNIQASPCS